MSVAVLVGMALGPRDVQAAEPRSFSLGWSRLPGAESCLSTRALARAVEERLGREVFTPATRAEIAIEGRITRREGGFHATLTLSDEQGQARGVRELSIPGDDCQAINESLVLVAALLIDPDAALAPRRPAPTAPATAAPALPAPPAASAPPAPSAPPSAPLGERPAPAGSPWRRGISVSGLVGVGMLPEASGGLLARVSVEPPSLGAIELLASSWLTARVRHDSGSGAEASLSYAGLSLCPVNLRRDRLRWQACAGGQFGSLSVRGTALDVNLLASNPVVNLAAQGRASLRLTGLLWLIGGAEAAVPLRRDVFFYRDRGGARQDLFRPAQLMVNAELGLGVIFP